ncbi:superoxide dismutase family protein [Rubrivirga sp. IMCC43871]|uniref:superoxide dismutase family protein n=1 Tax=Rubrivirga sp. IMCC43871 TaxID=3391575 RepID=UPI00398FE5E4
MRFLSAVFVAGLLLAACADSDAPAPAPVAPAPAPSGPERAEATVSEVAGSGVSGTVRFTALDSAVEVRYDLEGLAPGEHGFHVHQTGDCGADSTGTPAGAAGGHFNPLTSPHGAPSAVRTDRHAGDLGNIEAGPEGRAVGTRIDSLLAFSGPTSMVGKAVIVHAGRDDLESQPSGAAGDRVACGVISSGDSE